MEIRKFNIELLVHIERYLKCLLFSYSISLDFFCEFVVSLSNTFIPNPGQGFCFRKIYINFFFLEPLLKHAPFSASRTFLSELRIPMLLEEPSQHQYTDFYRENKKLFPIRRFISGVVWDV